VGHGPSVAIALGRLPVVLPLSVLAVGNLLLAVGTSFLHLHGVVTCCCGAAAALAVPFDAHASLYAALAVPRCRNSKETRQIATEVRATQIHEAAVASAHACAAAAAACRCRW